MAEPLAEALQTKMPVVPKGQRMTGEQISSSLTQFQPQKAQFEKDIAAATGEEAMAKQKQAEISKGKGPHRNAEAVTKCFRALCTTSQNRICASLAGGQDGWGCTGRRAHLIPVCECNNRGTACHSVKSIFN